MNPDFPAGHEVPKNLPARLAEKLESVGVSPQRFWEYAAMILVLGVIYYCDLTRGRAQAACNTTEQVISFSDLLLIFVKYFLYTAWPFALVACFDATWTSQDAGHVFVAAYIGANAVWFHHTGCGFCVFAAAFRIIPIVFCALLAHNLGAWRHCRRR
jgi:hypothetical protein